MTHTYKIAGMTCGNCEANVKSSFLIVANVTSVEVSREKGTATISMEKHIPLATLQNALDKKYTISSMEHNESVEQVKHWFQVYKPILLIFIYLLLITVAVAFDQHHFDWMRAMNVFMAGFFITFSFFKLLDLKGFAESYRNYDIVAKYIMSWGFLYPFIELLLGFAYLTSYQPILTNVVTLVVMSLGIIGVLQSVLNKKKIQCACLGVVFDLPMSTITIIENSLMIAMSIIMLYVLL